MGRVSAQGRGRGGAPPCPPLPPSRAGSVPLPCLRRTATELGQDGLVVLQVLIVVLDIPHGRVIYLQSFFGVLLGSELKCLSDRKPLAETGQDIVVVRHFRRGSLREPGRELPCALEI